MNGEQFSHTTFSERDRRAFEPATKVGILATVNPAGQPHLTLISSLMACGKQQMVWGQFIEGISKTFIRRNPKAGFLIMTLDKRVWRGTATFTHTATGGKEFDDYNNVPLFRYNAYMGIHTVYYMDLVGHSGESPLPMNRVVVAALQTMAARALAPKHAAADALNPWTRSLFNKLDNLKFLSYVGADGYPVVIPVIQAQALDRGRLIFSLGAYGEALAQVPAGAQVAVFGMALSMEDVLVRGSFQGVRRVAGMRCGVVALDWVYNPMPPKPMQIYPELPLEALTEF